MEKSDKLSVNWNEFRENLTQSFGNLRNDKDLTDMTLACEDGHQVEVHKLVLASSSPFFLDILKRNKHPRPLIYMRGLKSEVLASMLDFVYLGEAKIFQENLNPFLTLAEELGLKGLKGKTENESKFGEVIKLLNTKPAHPFVGDTKDKVKAKDYCDPLSDGAEVANALKNYNERKELKQLDEKINSMMQLTGHLMKNGSQHQRAAFSCKVCGKEANKSHMKEHIEAHHIAGLSHSCNICGKVSRSRSGLRLHNRQEHRNSTLF